MSVESQKGFAFRTQSTQRWDVSSGTSITFPEIVFATDEEESLHVVFTGQRVQAVVLCFMATPECCHVITLVACAEAG